MQKWMIAANEKLYDHVSAFQRWGFIDWKQTVHYAKGDIVYIYCTKPYQRVMYETVVEIQSMSPIEIVDDRQYWSRLEAYKNGLNGKYARLKLIEQVNSDRLGLDELQRHGLKRAPQGPIKVSDDLGRYIDTYMHSNYDSGVFLAEELPANSYEGAMKQVLVNKYERSPFARKKCIEYHGCKCSICGMDFEEKYGKLGEGFIHVHHIIPLNKISQEYIVDYKRDLLPVCPNCHAMLHRRLGGEEVTVEKLKEIINIGKTNRQEFK